MTKGNIVRLNERQVNTRKGMSTAYSMLVNVNGEEIWYGLGFNKPQFREGSVIEFQASQNNRGYWEADMSSVQVVKEAAPAGASTGTVAPTTNRDKSITLQTAYKVAPHIVEGMINADVLSFPKTKKEASQEAYMEMVHTIAYELQQRFLDPDKFNPLDEFEDVEGEEYGRFEE